MKLDTPLKIYNASAGSGKTYTLVQEYLGIILHDKNPYKFKTVLAMTFTNKAATEMKTRILDALIELSKPPHEKSDSEKQFLKDTSLNLNIAEQLIVDRAAKIKNAILHNFGLFAVMTIDKFTHRIIRTFAKDLNISMDFDVELDIKTLRKTVTDLLFDQIGRDPELTSLMLRYAERNLSEDKSWNFSDHVFKFSDHLFKEDAIKSIDLLKELSSEDFLKIQKDLIVENEKVKSQLIRNATEALDLIYSNALSADDFQGKSGSVVAYFKRIKSGNEFKLASPTLSNYVTSGKWGHPQSPNKSKADGLGPLLEKYFYQVYESLNGPYKKCLVNNEILKNLNNLSLLKHLLKLIEDIKEEENVLLISDFYKKISEVIAKEPVPFIYERLGVRYEHFLLDEFQDTSHLQWINMIPLVHNSLASGQTNLIVGDGKQAIYRWRNGEVEQFTGLPEIIHNPENIPSLKEAEQLFSTMGKRFNLPNNFRSAPEIVEFNNKIFATLAKELPPSVQKIYEGANQIAKKKFQGYIEGSFNENLNEESQLNYVLSIIQQSLDKGFALKDICILTRKNSTGAVISEFLTDQGIKVISPESLFIGKDLSVKFIFNLMCAAAKPTDRNAKIKTLEHFATLVKKNQPAILIDDWKTKCGDQSIEFYFETHGIKLKSPNYFQNLYEYTESLVDAFDLDLSENPFLQFFLEQVHLFEKNNNSSIREFIDWFLIKGAKNSIVSPAGANAVQVMTIFKAKGLEFPIVICPFFDWKMELHKQISWIENDDEKLPAYFVNMTSGLADTNLAPIFNEENAKFLLDNLNLLYVAFTRPEIALFISGSTKTAPSPVTIWLKKYFDECANFRKEGDLFKSGEFVFTELKAKPSVPNYSVEFLKQKMNKPTLSFKSAENWSVDDLDAERLFGTKMHLILSKLEAKNNLDFELNRQLDKRIITSEDAEKIKEQINKLFNNPVFAAYFVGDKIFNEKEIISSDGKKLIPDKIICHNNTWLVVDFKTGKELDEHKTQVKNYIKVLKEIGYSEVKGELFYTESGTAVSV